MLFLLVECSKPPPPLPPSICRASVESRTEGEGCLLSTLQVMLNTPPYCLASPHAGKQESKT